MRLGESRSAVCSAGWPSQTDCPPVVLAGMIVRTIVFSRRNPISVILGRGGRARARRSEDQTLPTPFCTARAAPEYPVVEGSAGKFPTKMAEAPRGPRFDLIPLQARVLGHPGRRLDPGFRSSARRLLWALARKRGFTALVAYFSHGARSAPRSPTTSLWANLVHSMRRGGGGDVGPRFVCCLLT